MGNCFGSIKKSTAEIAPYDNTKNSPIVTLYGTPNNTLTSYIRFALVYKPVSTRFVPSDSEEPSIQFGSETISGSRERLLQYIENKFPLPRLALSRVEHDETTPLIVVLARLQHRSMTWHMERVVRWVMDLETRGGRKRGGGDPTVGSIGMEARKFERSYSKLLEVMLEHAQMEERVVFPILEMADRGLSKAANKEHARDLPIMNGIKEDIKSICVLEAGSHAYREALFNLSTRLKSLLEHCKQHFEEEERDLLPLMEATEMSKDQQERVLLEQCLDVMQGTHSHLLHFFIDGLLPHDAMHYLDLVTRCIDKERAASMLQKLFD